MSLRPEHASMQQHMSGLVLGMTVKPRGTVVRAAPGGKPIRLLVRSGPNIHGKYVGYAFVLGGSANEANRDALPVPGPVLELTKGERVPITIVNQSHDQAAVHWHGIELGSYPDGVPGWSGSGTNVMPSISPGDSLTVRFTPPRAGTFMNHSHSNEMQQIGSGLYGAIVVSEPGVKRDTTRDRVLVISDGGPVVSFSDLRALPPQFVNGQASPRPIDIPADVPVRLRLIDIRTEFVTTLSLTENGVPIEWRLVAKDGMPTPAHQSGAKPATLTIAPGEIYDFEITRRAGTTFTVNYATGGLPPDLSKPGTLTIRAR
jgi:FtsP/CotA-like multicopper oxidase with cupredoxin domain